MAYGSSLKAANLDGHVIQPKKLQDSAASKVFSRPFTMMFMW